MSKIVTVEWVILSNKLHLLEILQKALSLIWLNILPKVYSFYFSSMLLFIFIPFLLTKEETSSKTSVIVIYTGSDRYEMRHRDRANVSRIFFFLVILTSFYLIIPVYHSTKKSLWPWVKKLRQTSFLTFYVFIFHFVVSLFY